MSPSRGRGVQIAHDREALLILFRATGGHLWRRKDNWNTDAGLSSWHGVTVNDDGRVIELCLKRNNLQGRSFLLLYLKPIY